MRVWTRKRVCIRFRIRIELGLKMKLALGIEFGLVKKYVRV